MQGVEGGWQERHAPGAQALRQGSRDQGARVKLLDPSPSPAPLLPVLVLLLAPIERDKFKTTFQ